MNCPKCGSLLAPGAAFCPVCNEPLAGYMPGYAPQTGYTQPVSGYVQPTAGTAAPPTYNTPAGAVPQSAAQQPGYVPPAGTQQPGYYPQGYASGYAQGGYPPGYQQPYVYGQASAREGSPLFSAVSALPRAFLDSFSRPADVLRGLMERRDVLTGLMVAGIMLVLAFLGGMVIMRSFVSVLLNGVSTLTGVSLASDAASMNQGVSYIAGRIAPSVGGVAVLCQLIGMVAPASVFMVYLCAVLKARFSWDLLLGFVGVTTLPTVAATLLAMIFSLITPWLSIMVMLVGMALSYTQACGLLPAVTGKPDSQLFTAKMVLVGVSLGVTLLLGGAVGGLLMGGVMRRVAVLISSVGSLI